MASTQTANELNLSDNRNIMGNSPAQANVGTVERWIAGIGGSALAVYGIARRDWSGAGLALLGAALIYRGTSGRSMGLHITQPQDQPISTNITPIPGDKGIRVQRTVTINHPAAELYGFWHDVENTPLYMPLVESVTRTGERTSHWVAQSPTGQRIEWNSEILEDQPGRFISWHVHGETLTGNAGKVSFKPAPGNRGTEATLELDYYQNPVVVAVGRIAGRAAEIQVMETLRRFKELMEAHEIPTTKGQPAGKGQPATSEGRRQLGML